MPETTTQGNLDSGDPELKKKAAVLVRGRLRALEQPAAWTSWHASRRGWEGRWPLEAVVARMSKDSSLTLGREAA